MGRTFYDDARKGSLNAKGFRFTGFSSDIPIWHQIPSFTESGQEPIQIEKLVHVDEQKYEEQPQIHLLPGDIVLTKDGTIGKACVIPPINEQLCAGSTVARIREFGEVDPYYLEAILNHEVVQVQIQSMATGLAQPHITQEWLAQLRVPLIPRNGEVAEGIQKYHKCLMRANALTTQAITSVESLIEGTLGEAACLAEGRKLADEFGLERP